VQPFKLLIIEQRVPEIDRAYVDGDPGEMLIEIAREGQRIDDRPSQEQAAP